MLRTKRCLLAAVVLAILAVAPAASAATWTVTTTADPVSPTCPSATDCSLRGAIAAATDGDTVVLGAGTYALTSGELQLYNGITIKGAGRSATIIDASAVVGSHRVIRIRGVVTHHVILEGLSVTGGAITDTGDSKGGGGIAHNDTLVPLYLNNVRVFGNSVTVDNGSYGGGGGIRSESSVYLSNSIVEGNTVTITNAKKQDGGGGLFLNNSSAHPNLVMSNSVVRDNTVTIDAIAPSAPNDCSVPIPGTTCPSNHGGGGVYVGGEDLSMTDSSITGNTVTVTNAFAESGGGGAFVNVGDATIVRSSISSNTATVTTTTDSTRPASNEGGGGLYQNGHDIVLTDSTVAGNALTVFGGTGNTPQDATNGGGGIYQFGNRITISGSTISGNTATVPASIRSGGGGLYDNGNAETIVNSTFQGNSAIVDPDSDAGDPESNGGGAIFLVGVKSGIQISNTTIAGNSAPQAAGGGILSYTNAGATWPLLQDSIVAANTSGIASTANCWAYPNAQITSLGYNLADDAANSCDFTETGDQIVASAGLSALADNGGPSATMALSPTSPAVDAGDPAGCSAAIGPVTTVDQRGVTRPQPSGTRCDIGAYELALPTASIAAATGVAGGVATLNGTAGNADAKSGTAYFEYGPTTAYGSRTASVTLGPLGSGSAMTALLESLAAGTWHYRLVVENAVGTARSADASFATPPLAVRFSSANTRKIRLRVTTTGAGSLALTGVRGTKRACGSTRSVAAAGTVTMICSLNAATRRYLKRHSAAIVLTTTFTPASGPKATTSTTVVVRRAAASATKPAGRPAPVTG